MRCLALRFSNQAEILLVEASFVQVFTASPPWCSRNCTVSAGTPVTADRNPGVRIMSNFCSADEEKLLIQEIQHMMMTQGMGLLVVSVW